MTVTETKSRQTKIGKQCSRASILFRKFVVDMICNTQDKCVHYIYCEVEQVLKIVSQNDKRQMNTWSYKVNEVVEAVKW